VITIWIINDRSTRRHFNEELMHAFVEYNENGTAQVPDDVGEKLVEHYDCIRPYSADED